MTPTDVRTSAVALVRCSDCRKLETPSGGSVLIETTPRGMSAESEAIAVAIDSIRCTPASRWNEGVVLKAFVTGKRIPAVSPLPMGSPPAI
jgi:hypothetical protein